MNSSINVLRLTVIAEFTLTIFSCGTCHTEYAKPNHAARLFFGIQIYLMLWHSLVTRGVGVYIGLKRKLFNIFLNRGKYMVNARNWRSHMLGRQYFVQIDFENTWIMISQLNDPLLIQCNCTFWKMKASQLNFF